MGVPNFKPLTNPDETIRDWARKLNHFTNYLSNAGYINVIAKNIIITDAGGYFYIKNVEAALQQLAQYNNFIKVTTKTITDNLLISDAGLILCSGAITLTLPTVFNNIGCQFSLTNIGTETVTIEGFGSEEIQGDLYIQIYPEENIRIASNGTAWYIS